MCITILSFVFSFIQANHHQVVKELQDDLKAQAAQTEVAAHEKEAIIERFEVSYK